MRSSGQGTGMFQRLRCPAESAVQQTPLSSTIVSEEFVATRPELATMADSQGKNALFNGFPIGSIHNHKPMTVHVVLVVESARKNRQPNLVRGNDLRHEFVV